jgi:hypothetical protein
MPKNRQEALQALQALVADYDAFSTEEQDIMTEASVVRQFIGRLLEEVLGWPINDPHRFEYERHTEAGRPDMTLTLPNNDYLYVEAKRFGIIKDLEIQQVKKSLSNTVTPDQMSLPGMAVDRTAEEQQAINYAFLNNGTWAILTNFEKLRLFNARRDWLVIAFERPHAYLEDFDLLWQLAYHNIEQGSLDMLSNQRYRADVDTDYLKLINDWREKLARDVMQNRAANPWAFDEGGNVNLGLLRAVVQRFIDRLVVVRFAEDHYVIPAGTLRSHKEFLSNANYYAPALADLLNDFFRKFDEQHNSALFAREVVDQAKFNEKTLISLIDDLYRARYRSMPADIMGNTYEQYLGKTLVQDNGGIVTRDNLETRKKQGSYYTPQVIVRYIVDNSLGRYLYGTVNGKPDGDPLDGETRKTSRDIENLRVLDSACGSGSFLIYAYEVLRDFYEAEIGRIEQQIIQISDEMAAEGKMPTDIHIETSALRLEIERLANSYPRFILEKHLYGVDLDPQAAEIAVVNLIMRAMEGQQRHQHRRRDRSGREISHRLPLILNQNVKVGNGLVGMRPDDPRLSDYQAELADIRRLRAALIKAPHGDTHDGIQHDLVAATAALNAKLTETLNLDAHFSDLERVRPFHWAAEFPEVFLDEDGHPSENPGFTMVVGNPPWEIVMPDEREFYAQFDPDVESRLQGKYAIKRIKELNNSDPRLEEMWLAQKLAIEEASTYFKSGNDYQHQYRGHTATHKLFVERAYQLLNQFGRLGYVIPAGIYKDLGTKELRQMLFSSGQVQYIYSFSNERGFFAGVHHDTKFTLLGAQKGISSDGFFATFRFNPRVAISPDELPSFLSDTSNLVYFRQETLSRFSPDSLSLMEFLSRKDYKIAETIYGDLPLIGDEVSNAWQIVLGQEFNMTTHRHLFNENSDGYPLYEGKMIHQYDVDYAKPKYWVKVSDAVEHFRTTKSSTDEIDFNIPRLGYREISRATNERSLIATILPPQTCCNHKIIVAAPRLSTFSLEEMLYSLAILNSLSLDYIVRFKITNGMNMFHFYQLPLPRLTSGNPYFDAIVPRAAKLTCTRPEFADLWQSVMGQTWDALAAATDPATRQHLRDEIDALVAHLYGLSRDDFNHILSTFPLVFPDNAAGQSKRDTLLAEYDRWGDTVKNWSRT